MEKRTKKLKLNLVLDKEQLEFIDELPKNMCSYHKKEREPLCRPTVVRIILNWAREHNEEVDVIGVKTEQELMERFLNNFKMKSSEKL